MTRLPLLDQIYQTGRVQDASGRDVDPYPQASRPAATDALTAVVRAEDARSTLEVGLAYGLSMLAICTPHLERGEGAHVAVDPHQTARWGGIGVLNAGRAGLSGVFRHVEAPSERALPRLWDEGLRVDLAFIDGLHLFDHCLIDFFYADRMLREGGVIAIDDVWMPAMRRVVAFARTNRSYELVDVPGSGDEPPSEGDRSGLAYSATNIAFLRKTRDDERDWDHHVPF